MTTSRTRPLVSLAALIVTVALGACAGSVPRQAGAWAPVEALPLAIRFENEGLEHVHVYLVGESRQWLLGRVEPGAIAILRIPVGAVAEHAGPVQLAAIAGGRITLHAARDARAQLTIAQSASHIMAQRWRFAQGQLVPQGRARSHAAAAPW